MRILVTNDDGYQAPGLAALVEVAAAWGEVTVVAPDTEQSYMGHRVSTKVVLRPVEYAPGRYHLNGTPADCVRIALRALDLRPDVVWSGINRGGNLGSDIYTSGTVAAAREAAYLGVSAVALSQYVNSAHPLDWARTVELAGRALRALQARGWNGSGRYFNINLPHPAAEAGLEGIEMRDCEPDPNPQDVRFSPVDGGYEFCGRYAHRPVTEGRDVALCFAGAITLTEMRL